MRALRASDIFIFIIIVRMEIHIMKEKAQKILKDPRIYPLYSFILTIITFCIILYAFDILGYGNNTILRSDLFEQYVPFIQSFLRVLKGEENFWYSFSTYLGSGSILTHAYYTLNPFNLLYLIDGISIFIMTAIIITLKLGLAAASFTFFAQKVLKSNAIASIIFAMCYALSTYSTTLHFNIMWLDALYLLPWIIFLIFRLIDTGKYFLLLFSYAYMFITNFYMAFIVGVFSAIIYLVYFQYSHDIRKKKNWKLFMITSGKFALSAILAACLCAILLLPAASFIFRHLAADNMEFQPLSPTLLDLVNTLFMGQMADLDNLLPFLYSGLLTLLIFPFYFINKEIPKKEKLFAAVPMLFLLICMFSLPLYKFMHAFDYPNFYAFRFAFLLIFLMTAAACRQFSFLHTIERPKLIMYAVGLIVLYSAIVPIHPLVFGALSTNNNDGLLINAAFIALWLILFQIAQKPRRCVPVLLLCLTMTELSVNAYLCDQQSQPAMPEDYINQWYYSEKDAVDTIHQKDNGFYRINVGNEPIFNSAHLFGYASFSTFSSSDDYTLRRALSHLGIATGNRIIFNLCQNDLNDLLFAAKYTIYLPPEDTLSLNGITQDNFYKSEISENPYALSLGYMVSSQVLQYTPTNDPFANQENLIAAMTGRTYDFYDAVPQEDISVSCDNISIEHIYDNIIFHHLSDKSPDSLVTYKIPHKENLDSYFYFYKNIPGLYEVATVIIYEQYGANGQSPINFGNMVKTIYKEDSDEDIIYIYSTDVSTDYFCSGIYTYYYDDRLLEDLYLDLSAGNMNLLEQQGNYIAATVTATEERPLLFTSIPYDDYWFVYVDGSLSQSVSLIEDAFLGVSLTPGEHLIELRYFEEGSNLGAKITLISIGIMLLLFLGYFVKKSITDSRQKVRKEPIQDDTAQDESVQDDTAQDESIQDDTAQDESV